jgi:hypothetical protein
MSAWIIIIDLVSSDEEEKEEEKENDDDSNGHYTDADELFEDSTVESLDTELGHIVESDSDDDDDIDIPAFPNHAAAA